MRGDDEQLEASADPSGEERPPEDRIQVVESSPGRLVLFIPGGGPSAQGLGCFALIWNGFLLVITAVFATVGLQKGLPWQAMIMVSVFWLFGLGMAFFAIQMRYERSLLLVERSRAVLQKTFFQRVRTDEVELAAGTSAALVEAYKQNDHPVYAIHLPGLGRTLKFGTALSHPEKTWTVRRVNRMLGVTTLDSEEETDDEEDEDEEPTIVRFPERCVQCGASLGSRENATAEDELACEFCGHVHRGTLAAPRTPASTSDGSFHPVGPFPADRVTIHEHSPERLQFSMRAIDNLIGRLALGGFLSFFALIWNSTAWGFVVGAALIPGWFKLAMLVFALPFVAIGAVVASIALFILFGRLRVTLDRNELAVRWGVGPLGYTRRLPTHEIDRVAIEKSPQSLFNQNRRGGSNLDQRTAIVWAGSRWIPLLGMQDIETAKHVAKLVKTQLTDMGVELETSS